MLIIRKEQMKVFEDAALHNFEIQMVEHVQKEFRAHGATIGKPGVKKVVKQGMEQAAHYGFTNKGPIRFYLELMFTLGSDFDTDPQYPWLTDMLIDRDSTDQMDRADRMFALTSVYFENVLGPHNKFEKQALTNIRRKRYNDYPRSEKDFAKETVRNLNELYPTKGAKTDEKTIYLLLNGADEQARKIGDDSLSAVSLFVLLMFTFGHHCFSDPQYPWIAQTLYDKKIKETAARRDQLHSKLTSYCDQILAQSKKK